MSAFDADARIVVFGLNQEGQAGIGSSDELLNLPMLVPNIDASTVVKVASSLKQSFLLTKEGSIFTAGANDSNELGRSGKRSVFQRLDALEGFKIIDMAIGDGYSILVASDGRCISWGKNESGQLGLGEGERQCVVKPKPVSVLREGVLQVSCGLAHTVVLTKSCNVYSFGANRKGQLGDGQVASSALPRMIPQLHHRPVVKISCGAEHTLALTVGGNVYSWGDNSSGQLGQGDIKTRLRPELIRSLRAARASHISCGKAHTAVISVSGLLFMFGNNGYGQCGHGDEDRIVPSPRPVAKFQESERIVIDCTLGAAHTLALVRGQADNSIPIVYVMGSNASGALGLSESGPIFTPVVLTVPALTSSGVGGISTGALSNHSFIFSSECSAYQRTPLPFVDLKILQHAANRLRRCSSSDQATALKNIREIVAAAYGSVSVLNASFRIPGSYGADGLCVDMPAVRDAYQVLLSCESDALLATLGRATLQATDQLTHISFDDPENLSCFLIILENPLLLSSTQYAVALERVCNGILAVPKTVQQTLFGWLKHYPSEYFTRIVLVLQGFLSYCIASLEAKVAIVCRVLSNLYEVNVETSIISDHFFVNDSVNNPKLVDIYSERRNHLDACQGGTNVRVFNYLQCPFLISEAHKANFMRLDFEAMKAAQMYRHKAKYILTQPVPPMPPGVLCLRRDSASTAIDSVDLYFELVVSRESLLHDVLRQLVAIVISDKDTLKLPLRVSFVGEGGIDQGGLRKELFSISMRELVAFTKILTPCSSGRFLWFSRDSSNSTKKADNLESAENHHTNGTTTTAQEELRMMLAILESAYLTDAKRDLGSPSECSGEFALGFLLGIAAYQDCLLDIRIPPSVYKVMRAAEAKDGSTVSLDRLLRLQDLYDTDQTLANSLQQILDFENGNLSDVFGVTFSCSSNPLLERAGADSFVELVPGGKDILVEKANRGRFVSLFVSHCLYLCCRDSIDLFLRGLRVFFSCSTVDTMCTPQEIETLLCGTREIGDLSVLRTSTVYRGGVLHDEHELVQWFWDTLSDLDQTEQRRFLTFLTGSDRVPAGGLSMLHLQIQHSPDPPESLPSAHTCFSTVDIPLSYPDKEWLRRKLLHALEYAEGFGMA